MKLGLGRVTHTRKAARGAAPGITTAEVFAKQRRDGEEEEEEEADDRVEPRVRPSGCVTGGSIQESAEVKIFVQVARERSNSFAEEEDDWPGFGGWDQGCDEGTHVSVGWEDSFAI